MNLHRRLYRSRSERLLAGVAGGTAAYFDIDPSIVRLLWLAGFLVTGPVAAVAYLACVFIVPREPETTLV